MGGPWPEIRRPRARRGRHQLYHLPEPTPGINPGWSGYLPTLHDGTGIDRNQLVRRLEERKVGTQMLSPAT
jgi:CDP-6-deoxy-D-xylo-4-hexulose-3-dehydrase